MTSLTTIVRQFGIRSKTSEERSEGGSGGGASAQHPRREEREERSERRHVAALERRSGSFVRSFKLPENATVDKLTACLENGVLTITVPKKEAKHYPKRSIEIYGGE
ncbi:class I heat shock protein-like [Hibiscus syriacus]|uniref:class I heat shock protein-like n=1 Tax=Hibiscus syriacus TaxID=106335 RepID=UPI001921B8A7|nr:class I heat shock protein-like [Hibiscus syriacus]